MITDILSFLTKITLYKPLKKFLEKIGVYNHLKNAYRSFLIFWGGKGLKLKIEGTLAKIIVSNPNELNTYQSLDGEKDFLQKFLNKINNESVFYDLGANIGLFSLSAAKYKIAPRFIYCWEPEPFNFKRLNENINLNNIRNIMTFPVALGSENTVLELWTEAKEPGSLTPSFARESFKSSKSVQVVKGDDWILERKLLSPSIIKIDVEGYEFNVLKGFERTLKEARPVLFLEIHPEFLKNLGIDKKQVLNFLANLNYEITFSSLRRKEEHYILETK